MVSIKVTNRSNKWMKDISKVLKLSMKKTKKLKGKGNGRRSNSRSGNESNASISSFSIPRSSPSRIITPPPRTPSRSNSRTPSRTYSRTSAYERNVFDEVLGILNRRQTTPSFEIVNSNVEIVPPPQNPPNPSPPAPRENVLIRPLTRLVLNESPSDSDRYENLVRMNLPRRRNPSSPSESSSGSNDNNANAGIRRQFTVYDAEFIDRLRLPPAIKKRIKQLAIKRRKAALIKFYRSRDGKVPRFLLRSPLPNPIGRPSQNYNEVHMRRRMVVNNRNIQRRRQEVRRQSPPEPSPEYSSTSVYSNTPINSNNVSPINIPANIPSTSSAFRRISTPPSISISPGNRPNSVRISPTVIHDNSEIPSPPPLRLRSPAPPPTLILRSPPPLTRRPSPLRLREPEIQLFPPSGPSPSPPPPFDKIKLKYNGTPPLNRVEFRYKEIPNNSNPITNELRRILNEFFELGNNTRELRKLLNEFCESDRSKAALERFKNGYMGLIRKERPVSAPLPNTNFPTRNNLRRFSFNEDITTPIQHNFDEVRIPSRQNDYDNNITAPESVEEIRIPSHQDSNEDSISAEHNFEEERIPSRQEERIPSRQEERIPIRASSNSTSLRGEFRKLLNDFCSSDRSNADLEHFNTHYMDNIRNFINRCI